MNIKNRTIFTKDNLPVLRGMDSDSVDLIYLDPPFNSNKHYSAPIGSKAAGAEFKDAWTFEDTDAAWWGELAEKHEALYRVIDAAGAAGGSGNKAYLIYMAMRLLELWRVLKPTGSIYLHCDPVMSHPLKMVMDTIFGKKQYRNEIVWHYTGRRMKSKNKYNSKHDIVFFYAKSNRAKIHSYPSERYEKEDYIKMKKQRVHQDNDGKEWIWGHAGAGKSHHYKIYLDEAVKTGRAVDDVWHFPIINTSAKERVGYPTQKPIALLKRIISASSDENDIVLDPFCGCATTCIAAEMLRRQWVGIDISPKAAELVVDRAEREIGGVFRLIHRTDIPVREAPPRSRNIKHILFGNQEGKCNGCKTIFPFSNFTLDHVVPRAKGGSDTDENLQLLCNYCNSVKGDRSMEYLLAKTRQK